MEKLKPCPWCGGKNIKLQTPAREDGFVHDGYFRCFDCGAQGPYLSIEPTPWQEVGKLPVAPIIEKWNNRKV